MPDLLVEKSGRTTIFTINRPERLNALNRTVMSELELGIQELNADPGQSVAIITGAGDRAFSAGADLKDMAASNSGESDTPQLPMSQQPDIAGIAASEKPVIAAVNGLAVAGGLEVAISCDLRICVPEAYFGVFEVQRGFLAGVAVNILPRLLPWGVAADMLMASERLTSEEALRYGLVQKVVERDKLLEAAVQKAETIASYSATAVWGSKKVIKYWRDLQLAEQQRYYEAVIHRVLLAGDFLEGPAAFAEKRTPKFADGWPVPGGN